MGDIYENARQRWYPRRDADKREKLQCMVDYTIKSYLGVFTRRFGRVPHWQCGGHRFDPDRLHHTKRTASYIACSPFFQ